MAQPHIHERHFLPDFGSPSIALRLVLFAELVAIVLAIGRNDGFTPAAWQDLKLLSLFMVSITVASLITLKLASPLLRRTSMATGSALTVLLVLVVIALGTDALIFMLHKYGFIPDRAPAWRESLLIRSLLIGLIVSALAVRYLVLQHRADQDARSHQEAQLQALQSRIRPHFLFNSLNSVASLTRSDPQRAEALLHDIADLFRVLLADARKLVPLAAEREISRQYLEIEKLRLGDRLKVKWNVGTLPRTAMIPALTLQPLLENAIYHGIEPRFAGGTVTIELWTEGDTLNIMISNPLPEVVRNQHSKGNKIAMDNIRQRLITQFGERAALQTFEEGGHYHAKVRIPVVQN